MTASPSGRQVVRLTVWGPAAGLVSHTIDQDKLTIGRANDNDLVMLDAMVSRQHLCIRREGAGWAIEDLDSRHGTIVDGRRLHGAAPLAPGARIRIGRIEMVFELVAGGAGSTHSELSSRGRQDPTLIGESAAMRQVRATIARVAGSALPVLLLGESGTGKEIAARLVHHLSPRADKPYVVVNCPALPGNLIEAELFGIEKNVATSVDARRGRLEEAGGGTLFLDELGDLDLGAQAKLLRFLQDKKIERVGGRKPITVDARVIAATHHDLPADVAAGRFRLDLYYRLNTFIVTLPPLRERREDIPVLVEHFLAAARTGKTAGPAALEFLRRCDFPGNVRELEAMVMRAALLTDGAVIGPEAFAGAPRAFPAREARGPSAGSGSATAAPRADDAAALAGADVEARALLDRMARGQSFWDVVQAPFLRRTLPAAVARRAMDIAYAEAGRSLRRMAARFGVTSFKSYKKLTDFLRHHDLRPARGPDDEE